MPLFRFYTSVSSLSSSPNIFYWRVKSQSLQYSDLKIGSSPKQPYSKGLLKITGQSGSYRVVVSLYLTWARPMLPGFASTVVLTWACKDLHLLAIFTVVVNPLQAIQSENRRTFISYVKSSEERALIYWKKNSVLS